MEQMGSTDGNIVIAEWVCVTTMVIKRVLE